MNEQQDYELEIDIIEWIREIKSHMALIIASALLFAAAAGSYVFLIKVPVYSYSKFINSPGLGEQSKLTFTNLFKNDIGIKLRENDGNQTSLALVEVVKSESVSRDIKDRYTSLIRFEFKGNNPDAIKEYADQYVDKSLQAINEYIEQQYEINFSKEYLETAKKELQNINNRIASSTMYLNEPDPAKMAIDYLMLLKERLETKELSKAINKAEIVESQSNEPQIVRDNKVILKSAALGLFLGFAYVTCRYFWRVVTESNNG